jgi:hypothetical protein
MISQDWYECSARLEEPPLVPPRLSAISSRDCANYSGQSRLSSSCVAGGIQQHREGGSFYESSSSSSSSHDYGATVPAMTGAPRLPTRAARFASAGARQQQQQQYPSSLNTAVVAPFRIPPPSPTRSSSMAQHRQSAFKPRTAMPHCPKGQRAGSSMASACTMSSSSQVCVPGGAQHAAFLPATSTESRSSSNSSSNSNSNSNSSAARETVTSLQARDIVGSQSALSSAVTFSSLDDPPIPFRAGGDGVGSYVASSRPCGSVSSFFAEPRNLAERIERDLELLGGCSGDKEEEEEERVGRDIVLLM